MLKEKIEKKTARVVIIGVGYVGLPLAVKLAETGFEVAGVDVKSKVIADLNNGISHVEGVTNDQINAVVKNGKLKFYLDTDSNDKELAHLGDFDVFLLCVHTPLLYGRGWEPDTQYIERAVRCLSNFLTHNKSASAVKPEKLLILESTTYPGTTKDLLLGLRDDSKLGLNDWYKFYVAYSPERVNPGVQDDLRDPFDIARIVGGADNDSTELAMLFYRKIYKQIHPVSSLEAAEFTKLLENTFRFVSIAFSNEMSRVAKLFNLDIWELITAAKTKGFGLDLCYPGLIGGHCIPIDPHYLAWAIRKCRHRAPFIDISATSHQVTRDNALKLILQVLTQNGKSIFQSKILLCGVTYKENVADLRESSSLDLIKNLYNFVVNVSVWDPIFEHRHTNDIIKVEFTEEEYENLPKEIKERIRENKGLQRKKIERNDMSPKTKVMGDPEACNDNSEIVIKHPLVSGKIWQDVNPEAFDCIVISTAHDLFLEGLKELLDKILDDANYPPIVDLRNAIDFWIVKGLKKNTLTEQEAKKIRDLLKELQKRRRYALLGRD